MAQDIDKADLVRELGYDLSPEVYEPLLRDAGLSNPRKRRIRADKADDVEALLGSRFFRACRRGDCRREADRRAGGREVVPVTEKEACEVCGGSVNARAVDEMIAACRAAGWTRLCVVGGSPGTHTELTSLVDGRLGLRIVDGTVARNRTAAQADIQWADRVVIWGGTMLGHRVSQLYDGPKVIALARRGIAALAEAVATSAQPA